MFAWSISGLKEPLFFLITSCGLVLAVQIARGSNLWRRAGAALALVLIAWVLETIRVPGAVITVASVVLGFAIALLAPRPRLLLATVVAVPILAGALLNRPAVQVTVYGALKAAARQHWGHVATPGYSYRLLDERFYTDAAVISDMGFREAGRFAVRAVTRYVTVPLPWEIQSRSALAYLPEQVVWYIIVALFPIGVLSALRRDPLLAGLLCGHAVVAALVIALTSGNIGTIVRHRGLALPYIVWLSAVGACDLLAGRSRRTDDPSALELASAAV
jgi:hypothetical protein